MIIATIFSFQERSEREYTVVIEAKNDSVSLIVPENVARDVAGNKNLRSNFLLVRHCKYSHSCLLLSAQL